MNKKNNCKNVGCCETFSWLMQVIRHRATCKYPQPVMQKKKQKNKNILLIVNTSVEDVQKNFPIKLA